MSYINDALKKAQKESSLCITPYETVIVESMTLKNSSKGRQFILFFFTLLFFLIIILYSFFEYNKNLKINNINIDVIKNNRNNSILQNDVNTYKGQKTKIQKNEIDQKVLSKETIFADSNNSSFSSYLKNENSKNIFSDLKENKKLEIVNKNENIIINNNLNANLKENKKYKTINNKQTNNKIIANIDKNKLEIENKNENIKTNNNTDLKDNKKYKIINNKQINNNITSNIANNKFEIVNESIKTNIKSNTDLKDSNKQINNTIISNLDNNKKEDKNNESHMNNKMKFDSLSVPLDIKNDNFLIEKKEPEQNNHFIKKKRELAPTDIFLKTNAFYEKALDFQIKNNYKSAIINYEKCLDLDPDMAPALNNLGVIMLRSKNYEKAEKYFMSAINKRPDYVDPYYNMACFYSQTLNTSKAIEFLKKAVFISEEARLWAITDNDFKPLYELKEFNMIISGN